MGFGGGFFFFFFGFHPYTLWITKAVDHSLIGWLLRGKLIQYWSPTNEILSYINEFPLTNYHKVNGS